MWRSARRSSGGVVVAARVAQVLLSSGIRRVAALRAPCTPGQRGRRTNRRSDRTSVRQRGLTAFVLGFDRPESMYIRREFLYIRRRYQLPRRYRARSRPRRGRGPALRFRKGPRGRATSERLRGMAHDGAGGVRELSLRDPPRHARRGARPRPAHAHAPRRPRAYRPHG